MNALRLRSCVITLALSALSVTLAGSASAASVKVACLGEQTTKSGEATYPMWPTLLQTALGSGYTVVNDAGDTAGSILTGYDTNGVGADPVMSATNTAYEDSLTANVVVIGPFGEHDERVVKKFAAMGTEAIFEADYDALVESYLNDATKPVVYVTTPIPVPTFDAATQTYVTSVVLPAVQAVAMKRSVKLIDLYTAFNGHMELFVGGVGDGQTNEAGEVQIEQMVDAAIQATLNGGSGGSGGGGAGGAGGSVGSSGSSGSGGSVGAAAGASAGGAANGGGGAGGMATSSAGAASVAGGPATSSGGTSGHLEPLETTPSQSSGCSISAGTGPQRTNLAWLALAGAFSTIAAARRRRR